MWHFYRLLWLIYNRMARFSESSSEERVGTYLTGSKQSGCTNIDPEAHHLWVNLSSWICRTRSMLQKGCSQDSIKVNCLELSPVLLHQLKFHLSSSLIWLSFYVHFLYSHMLLHFSPYFTFTLSSFHHDYLISLLQGHMAIHAPPL